MDRKRNELKNQETESFDSNSQNNTKKEIESLNQNNEKQKLFSIPKEGMRLTMLRSLWSGAAAGALTGYVYAVSKHVPVHPYIATYTMSFGFSSMLFAGVFSKLKESYGRNIATVSASGAITGTVLGLLLAPKQMPTFLLGFTGVAIVCNWSYDLFDFWRVRKGLKMKQERGIITEEEALKLEEMKHPLRQFSSRVQLPAWSPIQRERRSKQDNSNNKEDSLSENHRNNTE